MRPRFEEGAVRSVVFGQDGPRSGSFPVMAPCCLKAFGMLEPG